MSNQRLRFGGVSICVAEGWEDITASLEDADAPWTIAEPDSGVGALQFSLSSYKAGRSPDVSAQDLSELLEDFARKQGWEEPFDRSTYSGEVVIEGGSFRADDDFVRVWYASDGKNVALVTYVCEWEQRDEEASERESAVRSLRFSH